MEDKLTVAHVGFTGTEMDKLRVSRVLEYCYEHGISIPSRSVLIDLNRGHDFLIGTEKYDIVVLHYLCRDDPGKRQRLAETLQRIYSLPLLRISPHASWENWRKRLQSTEARYIFCFGGIGEVGYSFLVNIDGYRMEVIDQEAEFGVFIRE